MVPLLCTLISLLVITHISSEVAALTDEEKWKQARSLIKHHFHSADNPARIWTKINPTNTNTPPPYDRYEVSNREYCTGSNLEDAAQICWRITVHVHPTEKKQFDRVYAFDTSVDPAFLGTYNPI